MRRWSSTRTSTRLRSLARPKWDVRFAGARLTSHKRLSLELGGKSPFIVFEDADLDSAVEGLVDGIWFNQGQVCCAGSRLLMQESIAEALISKIRDADEHAAHRAAARQGDRHRRHRGARSTGTNPAHGGAGRSGRRNLLAADKSRCRRAAFTFHRRF